MAFLYIYFFIVSLTAIVLTVHDKRAAQRHAWRVKERTLLLAAVLGGSVAMYLTMQLIRHKTRHAKFMVGLPLIAVAQIVLIILIWRYF